MIDLLLLLVVGIVSVLVGDLLSYWLQVQFLERWRTRQTIKSLDVSSLVTTYTKAFQENAKAELHHLSNPYEGSVLCGHSGLFDGIVVAGKALPDGTRLCASCLAVCRSDFPERVGCYDNVLVEDPAK